MVGSSGPTCGAAGRPGEVRPRAERTASSGQSETATAVTRSASPVRDPLVTSNAHQPKSASSTSVALSPTARRNAQGGSGAAGCAVSWPRGSRSAEPAGQSARARTATVAAMPWLSEPPTGGRGKATSAMVATPPTASRKRLGSPAACSTAATDR